MEWVGWGNYLELLQDGEFRWSMLLTLIYAGMTIPGTIFVSLMLALILNSGLFGKAFSFRILPAQRSRYACSWLYLAAHLQP